MSDDGLGIDGITAGELVGRGGFGRVYRARDEAHGRDVAVKVLTATPGDTERNRFDRERQSMGRVGEHPNIVQVHASGYTPGGEPYLVMELATGGSLADRLAASGPVPWPEAVELIAQVCAGAQAAHDAGILHRDIKPENILLSRYGVPKLTDFGIASLAGGTTTASGASASLAHASPELLEGRTLTAATDIYALGSTLFTLIAGYPPFRRAADDAPATMIRRILAEPAPDLRPLGVPPALAAEIERALAKEPSQRHPSAAHLGAALSAIPRPTAPVTPRPSAPGFALDQERTTAGGFDRTGPPVPGPGVTTGPVTGPMPTYPPPSAAAPPAPPARTPTPPPVPPPSATGPVPPTGPVTAPLPLAGGPPPRSGNRNLLIGAGVAAAVVVLGIVAVLVLGGGGGDGVAAGGTATTTAAASGEPTVMVDCPSRVVFGVQTICDIVSVGATSGSWEVPGFTTSAIALEVVPGSNRVFIEPTVPATVGQSFTLSVEVRSDTGATASANHVFTVVADTDPTSTTVPTGATGAPTPSPSTTAASGGATSTTRPPQQTTTTTTAAPAPTPPPTPPPTAPPAPAATISIQCPGELPVFETVVCDIVTTNTASGSWSVPGFAAGTFPLDVVNGPNSIFLETIDATAIGERFTLRVTVTGTNGAQVSANHSFTVVE